MGGDGVTTNLIRPNPKKWFSSLKWLYKIQPNPSNPLMFELIIGFSVEPA